LAELPFPLPPRAEQRRIIARSEELQVRIRTVREALKAIPPLLEQFRQSVLAAAFRGDLTDDWRARNSDVEPASVLLDRMRVERQRLWEIAKQDEKAAGGRLPASEKWRLKYRPPSPLDQDGLPDLPRGWCWTTWNHLSEWVTYGFTRPMPHVENGPAIVTAKNVLEGRLSLDEVHRTTKGSFDQLSSKDIPEPGDILITKDGSIGRAAVVPEMEPFCINQSVAVVFLRSCPIDRKFLLRVIQAPFTQEKIRQKSRGMAIPHLSISDFSDMLVPLPPIAEQRRILEVLEATLGLITRVEAKAIRLTRDCDDLDQTILAKAFRGELVPQDPTDEPASVLLERIRAEREAAGGTKRRGRRAAGAAT
jgi:type I restriction enzyme S subunit